MNERDYIMKVLDVLEAISKTKGTGSAMVKRALLKTLLDEGSQEMYLIYILRTAFDPMWVTHINKIEIQHLNTYNTDFDIVKLVELLKDVKAVNNDLRLTVNSYVNSFPLSYRQMLANVLTKSMNIGIGIKEINKVFDKEIIRDVELMKCEKEISIVEKWFNEGKEVFAEMKYDGIRGFAEMNNGVCIAIKTYNMSDFDISKMTTLVPQLESLSRIWNLYNQNKHFFFDFEITGKDRQSVGGEINSLLKNCAKEDCDKNWIANIFDIHTWDVFEGKKSNCPYNHRRKVLEEIYKETSENYALTNVIITQRWLVKSKEELMTLFTKMLESGIEGLVVKLGSGIYELKYSNLWVKMKAIKECDLRILGWFKGSTGTKREHTIGGFICESEDKLLQVNPGSGFTDKILEEIMQNGPDSYIGKICEVRYNSIISKEGSNVKSLFLPRFVRIRFDKDIADTLERIEKK